ncbi:hypothetical protein MRB53_022198 [Persea americana]|uniref:Uncharacterized protein n=1 Tax=Persea americana TaxID=3435 RepID=A0ACC2L618_PERAE|nr:hypothetical protein MRB53_022198 [Persea americana]
MAMRSFYNEIKGMKVKDLPSHIKPMLSIDYIKKSISKAMDNYHAKASPPRTPAARKGAWRSLINRSRVDGFS